MNTYLRLGLVSLVMLSNLSATSLLTSAEIKKMDAFETSIAKRVKQQALFDAMDETAYEAEALYIKAEEDTKWVKNAMKNFDYHISLKTIEMHEKKITKMKNSKHAPYLKSQIKALESLIKTRKLQLQKKD